MSAFDALIWFLLGFGFGTGAMGLACVAFLTDVEDAVRGLLDEDGAS